MKKVLTAIGNTILNEKLFESGKYEVIARDIQYKEGILEFLNIDTNIDILIISELLEGEMDFKELISRITNINENINIIVFLEYENIELRSFLFSKGISKIYINNEIDIETFIINLEDNMLDKTQKLNEEIKKLKEIIKKQEEKYVIKEKGKIIAVSGSYGSGKSVFSCILCKELVKHQKKTLLIDFDTYNSSINVMYNVPKYMNHIDNVNIKEQIIKISKYEHLLCATDLIFSDENTMNYISLEKMLEEFKLEYDEIIIDTTSNFKNPYLKKILNLVDNIVYLVVPSISEIKKAISLYEIIKKDFKVTEKKIKIVVNKENNYSIDSNIIAKIFNVSRIKGKLKYIEEIENNIYHKIKKKNIKIDSII